MQTASNARIASLSTLSGMTYIDTLISGATAQGHLFIVANNTDITPAMITTLQTNGYNVNIRHSDGNTDFPQYHISW